MFCGNCGVEINDGSEFCPKCGAKNGVPVKNRNKGKLFIIICGITGFLLTLIGIIMPSKVRASGFYWMRADPMVDNTLKYIFIFIGIILMVISVVGYLKKK